jgi:hypothetical protein
MTQASPTSIMLLTPTSLPSTCEHIERQLDCQETPVMEPEDDPYYGHAATAVLCSRFVSFLMMLLSPLKLRESDSL